MGVFILTDRVECVFSFQYLKTSIRTLTSALSALVSRNEFAGCDDDSLGTLLSDLAAYVGAQYKDYYKTRPVCPLHLAIFSTRCDRLLERFQALRLEAATRVVLYQLEPPAGGLPQDDERCVVSPATWWLSVRRLPAEAVALDAALKSLLLTAPGSPATVLLCLAQDDAREDGDIQCHVREVLLPFADTSDVGSSSRCPRRLRAVRLLRRDAPCESLVHGEPLALLPQPGAEAALTALCRQLKARCSLLVLRDDDRRRLLVALPAASGHSLLVRRLAPPELLLPPPPPPPAEACSPDLERRMGGLLSRLEQGGFSVVEPTPGFYEALVEQLRASLAFSASVPRSRAQPSKATKNSRQPPRDAP
ncbi:uncharacterized protein LOC119440806 isoform X1 [Dermacentor silvarum]|uniref:uncharacterized protein LOC119440806 isoform X1 n=1 Tax=Dermacentor silvarum TaxID=543639 RepID=UPI00210123BF|nr:uncharacterized protein LOC119440806 isoform X1 [Dermacentor silvarum]